MNNNKTEEELSARKRVTECKKHESKDEQIKCMFKVLHDVTTAQDITNLIIRKEVDDSNDKRWIPIHMIDDANGVILELSRLRGNPESALASGYVDEKVNKLSDKLYMLKSKYRKD